MLLSRPNRAGQGKVVSRAEVAILFGVSTQTVDAWVRKGLSCDKQKNATMFNTAQVAKWLEERAAEQAVSIDASKVDIDEAKRRKIVAEAALSELELAREQGAVVEIEDVAAEIDEQLANVRAKLLGLAPKCAPMIVAAEDLNEVKAVLEDAVREALDELVGYGTAEAERRSSRRDLSPDGDDIEAAA